MSVNKVILIGNLGKDPEVKHLESGKTVANFSIATSEKYKDNETTTWHNIVMWGPLAEVAEKWLKKGDKIYLEGKINKSSYEDKEGQTRYVTEIVARDLRMLGGGKDIQAKDRGSASEAKVTTQESDDLPF